MLPTRKYYIIWIVWKIHKPIHTVKYDKLIKFDSQPMGITEHLRGFDGGLQKIL